MLKLTPTPIVQWVVRRPNCAVAQSDGKCYDVICSELIEFISAAACCVHSSLRLFRCTAKVALIRNAEWAWRITREQI